ncbi:unnamed protein product [Amoebophrya sp. A25]|nr:unnamed protein product [Amoebophrya sp. A25]|eukprot:GSA25T00024754001.1
MPSVSPVSKWGESRQLAAGTGILDSPKSGPAKQPSEQTGALVSPYMVEKDTGIAKDDLQVLTRGGQTKFPTTQELENFRPFAHYFHPQRYGVQKWRLFKIRIPLKLQKQLHHFLDEEPSIAEGISYWGARMVFSFGAPKNLMLSILTDYTWFCTLLLIEALIEGKLEALREALFLAFQDREQSKRDQKYITEVRKEYFETVSVMKDQLRFMSEDTQTVKSAYESVVAQLFGAEDVSFINSDFWMKLSPEDKELVKLFLADKVKTAFQSGRAAMKGVVADTIQNFIAVQRERDTLMRKMDALAAQKEEAENALVQRDRLITALKGSGGNSEFLDQIQALQDKLKYLQDFFRTVEQEKIALENKCRKLEEAGGGASSAMAALMPVDEPGESVDDLKKQLAAMRQQNEQLTREKREADKQLKMAEKEIERMGDIRTDVGGKRGSQGGDSRPSTQGSGNKSGSGRGDAGNIDLNAEELAALEKEMALLRDRCDNLEQDNAQLGGENMDLRSQVDKLMAELAIAKKEASTAKKDAAKLEAKMGKMESRMQELTEQASAAGLTIPVTELSPSASPAASPSSRARSSPDDDYANIDQYRMPVDSADGSRLPSREKTPFGRGAPVESEEEWVFPGEAPLNARTEQREVRVQGLSGYRIKELDDKVAKITEIETGKEFRVQRKVVEKRTWVFVDTHPDAEDLQVSIKKMRPGTVPVPEAMMPMNPDGEFEIARQVAGVPYVVSNAGSKPGSRGAASSRSGLNGASGYTGAGGRPYSKPASSRGGGISGGASGSGGPSGGASGGGSGSDGEREWEFKDYGNDQGEIVYAGMDEKKRGQSYKIQNKVQEKKNVYVPIEENPILNDEGEPIANELTIEHVLNPEQMRRNADRFEVVGTEEGNTRVVVDKETKEQFVMQKATRVEVDMKTQQIRRLEKLVAQLRAELEEKEVYAKKLEAAVTELQSKFADMKQALAKAGVKSNLIDAALKDSGITNLLFGAKSIRKVYERLYQDALDRMIRQENRAGKHWSGQQRSLMSVLHTSGQDMTAEDQRKMYQEFYKGFETFEAALQKRVRSNAIIRKASPKSSPKRYRSQEEMRKSLNSYVASNFYQPPMAGGRISLGQSLLSTEDPSTTTLMYTKSHLAEQSSFIQQSSSLMTKENSLRQASPRQLQTPNKATVRPDGAVASQRRLVEDGHLLAAQGGIETLRIGEPGPRAGGRPGDMRIRDARHSNRSPPPPGSVSMMRAPLYYGDSEGAPAPIVADRTPAWMRRASPPPKMGNLDAAMPSEALGLAGTSFSLLNSPTITFSEHFTHSLSVDSIDRTQAGGASSSSVEPLPHKAGTGVGSMLKGGRIARGLTPGTTIGRDSAFAGSSGLATTVGQTTITQDSMRIGHDTLKSKLENSSQRLTRSRSPDSMGHTLSASAGPGDLHIGNMVSPEKKKTLIVAQLPSPKRIKSGRTHSRGGDGVDQPEESSTSQIFRPNSSLEAANSSTSMHITSYHESQMLSSQELTIDAASIRRTASKMEEAELRHSQSVTLPILDTTANQLTTPKIGNSGKRSPRALPGMGHSQFVKKQPQQQKMSNRLKFLVSMNNPSGIHPETQGSASSGQKNK